MSVPNKIAILLNGLQCIGREWAVVGDQILCDNTPIFQMPIEAGDPAMMMRNDLLRELTRIVNDYSLTEKLALKNTGPWTMRNGYLFLSSTGLATICDPESYQASFQQAAARLFLNIANTVTPLRFDFQHVDEPTIQPDGYSEEHSVSMKRTFAVTPDLQIVDVSTVVKGDDIYESVYSNLYDFVVIKHYKFDPEQLDVEPTVLTPTEYSELQDVLPDMVKLLRFSDDTSLPVLTMPKQHTHVFIQ